MTLLHVIKIGVSQAIAHELARSVKGGTGLWPPICISD